MLNKISKINTWVKTLDQREWDGLGNYIRHFTANKRIIQLYNYLNEHSRQHEFSKFEIYHAAFENETYDDNAYRQIQFQFKKYEQYILSKIKRDGIDDQVRIAKHYKKSKIKNKVPMHSLDKLYRGIHSIHEYKAIYYLESEKMDEILQMNDRTKEPNLQVLNDVLDNLYLIEKFKIVCSAINYANINQYEYDFGLINDIESKIAHKIALADGLLYGMYKVYQLMKYREEKYYLELNHWIEQSKIEHTEEYELIFLMMNNFCIRQINQGNTDYFKQLFLLNQITIANGLVFNENGQISPHAAKNIIAVSLRLKEYTWTKNFIENIELKLKEDIREETLSYLWARYAYENREYEKALKHLAITFPIDMLNNSSFRVLQLKCLYELDEYEMMDIALENFRLYLIRHKNQTNYYYSNANFIKYLKQIIKQNKNKTKHIIDKKIQDEKLVAEKAWLISIIK